ncbi:hypothetical protein GALMADRAFT_241264 [Galerina marginata CBS 339.88]|uniref:Uncharacterized protein n=1 Tax=Galerina marginata (strain CBS 339.88) TaxID=685588 RepID=A0A067TEN1_GALM3|nr:hypothetical protein GALMADRAFT_241264 [Galerina marginata CBS 339.88]
MAGSLPPIPIPGPALPMLLSPTCAEWGSCREYGCGERVWVCGGDQPASFVLVLPPLAGGGRPESE